MGARGYTTTRSTSLLVQTLPQQSNRFRLCLTSPALYNRPASIQDALFTPCLYAPPLQGDRALKAATQPLAISFRDADCQCLGDSDARVLAFLKVVICPRNNCKELILRTLWTDSWQHILLRCQVNGVHTNRGQLFWVLSEK